MKSSGQEFDFQGRHLFFNACINALDVCIVYRQREEVWLILLSQQFFISQLPQKGGDGRRQGEVPSM